MNRFLVPALVAVSIISLLTAVLTYLRFTPRRPIVTVGNEPISRYEYELVLDEKAGRSILTKLVYSALVTQAATKAGVMPTKQDVDARMADLQRRSPQLASTAQDPTALKELRDDVTTDLALENLRMQGVTASDAEIAAFYARNRAAFTTPSQVQTTMVVAESALDVQSAVHLLTQNVAPALIARQPRLRVAGIDGFNVDMTQLPPAVRQTIGKQVLTMKPGQIKAVPVGRYTFIFKAKGVQPAQTPSLAQIRGEVTRQVKLQKALSPQQEIAALYEANPPNFNVDRYSTFFSDIQNYNAQTMSRKKVASTQP